MVVCVREFECLYVCLLVNYWAIICSATIYRHLLPVCDVIVCFGAKSCSWSLALVSCTLIGCYSAYVFCALSSEWLCVFSVRLGSYKSIGACSYAHQLLCINTIAISHHRLTYFYTLTHIFAFFFINSVLPCVFLCMLCVFLRVFCVYFSGQC